MYRISIFLCMVLVCVNAHAATLVGVFTGNFTASSWLTGDSTSLNDTEGANTALTTSYQESSTFTPGGITVDGIAVKVASRAAGSPSNTLSIRIALAGVTVTGTETVMNVSDIANSAGCSTAALDCGWYYFRFNVAGTPTPVVLAPATVYSVSAKLSATTTAVNLYSTATTNWARVLATTTTAAPAAADRLMILGDNLAAGTKNSYTITMDNTATTSFGTVSTQAFTVNNRGTLTYGTSASTNYYLKVKGPIRIFSGGTWNMGTSGTRMPSTSTAVLEHDSTSNTDSGIECRNVSTCNFYGATKSATVATLNNDEAAGQTVIGPLASSAGWAAGDVIAFASTTATSTQAEKKTILTVDSISQVTLTAGLTNAHSGTSPTEAEIVNLTRNVKVRGVSTSLQGYVLCDDTAVCNASYVEFLQLGGSTTDKKGIEIQSTTGSTLIEYSSFYDFSASGATFVNVTGSNWNNVILQFNVGFNSSSFGIVTIATSAANYTIDSNTIISVSSGGGSGDFTFGDVSGNITNNVASGAQSGSAITLNESGATIANFSGNRAHSNNGSGLSITSTLSGVVDNFTFWRNSSGGGAGITLQGVGDITIQNVTGFGNANANIDILNGSGKIELNSSVLDAGSTVTSPIGIRFTAGGVANFNCNSSTLGDTTAHGTGDISITTAGTAVYARFNNCLFDSATEIAGQTNLAPSSFIGSEKHDQVSGSNKTWRARGTLSLDAVIFDVTPSIRMTPNNASNKLESLPFKVAAKSGSAITASIKVRQSVVGDAGGANYNGNRIRLIVKKNYSLGITSDTVLATATGSSSGAFETISGTTASPSEDGVLDFVVDCDGTAGWANADTFTATPVNDSKGFKYWQDGSPVVQGGGSGGSAGFVIL